MCTKICGRHPAECWEHCRSEYQPSRSRLTGRNAGQMLVLLSDCCWPLFLSFSTTVTIFTENICIPSPTSPPPPDSWCHHHHHHFSCFGIQSSDTLGRSHPPAVPPSGRKFGVAGFQSVAGLGCLSQGFQELKIQGVCCSALPGS